MIEEQAIVVGIESNLALLEILRRKPCGLCGQTKGCGVSLWGRLFGHRSTVFKAENNINAKEGDSVIVGVEENALMSSAVSFYGVPLASLLAGAMPSIFPLWLPILIFTPHWVVRWVLSLVFCGSRHTPKAVVWMRVIDL